jgi:dihydroorotate dehydrogenase electron transfer subunit
MTPAACEALPIGHVKGRVAASALNDAGYCRLIVEQPEIAHRSRPGQLVYVACQSEGEERLFANRRCEPETRRGRFSDLRILRRPFAIAGRQGDCIVLLLKVVGAGSRWLARRREGQSLDLVGPLGNGFDLDGVERALLVGGGTGLASLLSLAQECAGRGVKATAVVGARTLQASPLPWRQTAAGRAIEELEAMGVESLLVTEKEDALLATQPVEEMLSHMKPGEVDVFACGPWAMMARVAEITRGRFCCQVSLEARMGCGVGACRTCAVPIRAGAGWNYKTVCRDGPVFSAEEVVWEKPPI